MKQRDTFLKRLCYAAIPVFLLVFIYAFFLPIEAVTANATYLYFTYHDILTELVVIFLGVALALTLVVSLFRGGLFEGIVLGITGLTIASYVQYMFLNPDFGVLDGTAINWHTYTTEALLNLLVWAGILIALFLLKKQLSKDTLHTIVLFACVVIFAAQAVGAVSLMVNSEPKDRRYMSANDRMTVSANDNVIVFLPDGISNVLFEEVIETYPDIKEALKDFTYYNNANCNTRTTFPGLVAWLTGQIYDGSESISSFFENAWTDELALKFYSTLKEKNYAVNLYAKGTLLTDDMDHLEPIADNMAESEQTYLNMEAFSSLYKLSAFRCFPLIMKAPMWITTGDIQNICSFSTDNNIYSNHKFINEFRAGQLETDPEKNYYIVQYLKGGHSPYQTDENGVYVSGGTTHVAQTAGYLRVIVEYINQLKELGVYDDATIIISADHGEWDYLQFAYLIKKPNDTHETMPVTNAPISPQKEHLATVMELLGEDGFGPSIFDYYEDQVITRVCTYPKYDKRYPAVKKFGANAEGNNNVIYSIEYEGDRDTLFEQFKTPTEVLPLYESYF